MVERLKSIVAALAACAVLAACSQQDASRLKSVSGLLPDLAFTLTDDAGRAVGERDYRGDVVLLFFGFTSCPDVCPTTLARLALALRGMRAGGEDVRVLFVTVDPARDTVGRLREYVRAFGSEFVGLRGTSEALRKLAKRYRIAYSLGKPDASGQYEVTHSSGVFVFDRAGRARYLILPDHSEAAIAEELDRLAAEPPPWGRSQSPPSPRPEEARAAGPPAAREAPEAKTARLALEAGETLLGALDRAGVPSREAHAATKSLATVVDPRSLKAGQEIKLGLRRSPDGALHLQRLELVPSTDRLVAVNRADERFVAQVQMIEHDTTLILAKGKIVGSLDEAARGQGVPAPVLVQAYRVLSHAVDLQRDIRRGDAFALGYESSDDGEHGETHPGKLRYASLTLSGQTLDVYRHATDVGYEGFFGSDGRSIETSLMRTPIDGGRLSSLFGKRDHPILGYTRMHKGLDFAAPRGAPVLATGDGTVVRRSRNGSFGNYIQIRHDRAYATLYAHLSRYAKGLKRGDRVSQGEVIGYVGATGLATGPNLHYEVSANGNSINPMMLDLPARRILSGEELVRFRRAAAALRVALQPAVPRRVSPPVSPQENGQ